VGWSLRASPCARVMLMTPLLRYSLGESTPLSSSSLSPYLPPSPLPLHMGVCSVLYATEQIVCQ